MITLSVNGNAYPPLERKFINKNLEQTTDNVTLDNSMYTDFTGNSYDQWTISYKTLTEAQYEAIRADYDAQFATSQYPIIDIPFFGVEDQPARMYLDERDIWNNCGDVEGLQIVFRETAQLPADS